MGARSELVPRVVQAPEDSVSARLDEVQLLLQFIKSIRWESQLPEVQGEQVEAELSIFTRDHMASHFSGEIEGASEMVEKLQAEGCSCVDWLLELLRESYLRLGRAYIEDGQFNRALVAVKCACLTQGETLKCHYSEEKIRKLVDLRDPKAAEFAWHMSRLTPPKNAFLPNVGSREQAWILAGDAYLEAYFEAQRTFGDSDVVISHQEGEDSEEIKMWQEVMEVRRVVSSCGCYPVLFVLGFLSSREGRPLPRILEKKWEMNLSAAVECYSNASAGIIGYLKGKESENEDSEDEDSKTEYSGNEDSENKYSRFRKIAYRKKGLACHEYGRRLAELGWHARDEADKFFRKAISALRKGKDLPNFKLALCSRIEYRRKLAEFRETQQGPEGRTKIMEEARVKYQEALHLCTEAKEKLKKWGDGQHDEVDTEEAHTYLKLGMFLTRDAKQEDPNREDQILAEEALHEAINLYIKLDRKREVTHARFQLKCTLRERKMFLSVESDNAEEAQKNSKQGILEAHKILKEAILRRREDKFCYDNHQKPRRIRGQISTEGAFRKAIYLYTKLDRKKEVAYAQFQLGCVLRDRLVFDSDKSEVNVLKKRLIDVWEEASKYYIDRKTLDSDMFLRIRMEHSQLYLALRLETQKNEGLDEALEALLEGCRYVGFTRTDVFEEFICRLEDLLRDMCHVAKSQQNITSSSNPSKANNYKLVAQIYGLALKCKGGVDYGSLYHTWNNH